VIKAIEFPDSVFSSREDLFRALKRNEETLIGLKKAKVYKSCEKGQYTYLNVDFHKSTGSAKSSMDFKAENIYPVISTTRYMDSHMDVHFDGCFRKTVKEQKGKAYYALDHELRFDSIIAWPSDVNMVVANLDWSLVGKNYSGQTEALVFEISKEKVVRKDVLEAIENRKSDFENSIRMVYHKIRLGVNSDDKDLKENKRYFDERIDLIANKEVALEAGYFWGVEELGIYKEGSLVIAGGSNDATSIITVDDPAKANPNKEVTRPVGSYMLYQLI